MSSEIQQTNPPTDSNLESTPIPQGANHPSPTSPPKSALAGESQSTPHSVPATATNTAPSNPPVLATAQPASAATMPVPTSAAPATYTPTPTTATPSSTATRDLSPPAPQPGARPEPIQELQHQQAPQLNLSIPPPPKVGEPPVAQPQYNNQYQTTPYYQPPTATSATTTTTTTGSSTHNNNNPFATSHPRHSYNYNSYTYSPNYAYNAAPGASTMGTGIRAPGELDEDEDSLYNTAKSWLQAAGTKLAEAEAAVWKKINDAHDR